MDCKREREDAERKTFSNYSGHNEHTNSLLLLKLVSQSLDALLLSIYGLVSDLEIIFT